MRSVDQTPTIFTTMSPDYRKGLTRDGPRIDPLHRRAQTPTAIFVRFRAGSRSLDGWLSGLLRIVIMRRTTAPEAIRRPTGHGDTQGPVIGADRHSYRIGDRLEFLQRTSRDRPRGRRGFVSRREGPPRRMMPGLGRGGRGTKAEGNADGSERTTNTLHLINSFL
jgi:hypothetical protein